MSTTTRCPNCDRWLMNADRATGVCIRCGTQLPLPHPDTLKADETRIEALGRRAGDTGGAPKEAK